MATSIIDAMVVTLGLDASNFKKGQEETSAALKRTSGDAATTAKDLQEFGKQGAEFFAAIKTEALGLLGVLAGSAGLGAVLSKTADGLSALKSASINIGQITPQALQALDMAFHRNSASATAAADALKEYATQRQRAIYGSNPEFTAQLNLIGGTLQDTPEQIIQKLQGYVEAHRNEPGGAARIQLAFNALGFAGLADAMLRIGTVAKLNEEIALSVHGIGVASDDAIEKALKLQHAFYDLGDALGVFNTRLLAAFGWLAPIIEWLAARGDPKDWKENPYDAPATGVTPGGLWERLFGGGGSSGTPATSSGGGVAGGGSSQSRLAFIRDALAQELGISKDAAAGIVSNLNAESGLQGINEAHPAPGTRGGFGWAQWTGPRRDAFEAYARANFLPVESDAANMGFLIQELRAKYPGLLAQLRAGNITADQAANLFFQYESGGDLGMEKNRAGHVAGAAGISHLVPSPASRSPGASGGASSGAGGAATPGRGTSLTIGSLNLTLPHVTDAAGMARGAVGALAAELTTQANVGLV